MPSKQLQVGDIVMAADGKDLGSVKELGDTCFRIAAQHARDYWLSNDAVEGRDKGIAVLLYDHDRLGDAFVDVLAHTGQHSHPKRPSTGGQNLVKPLLMLAGIGAMAMRDKERREKVIAMTKKGVAEVKARVAKTKDDDSTEAPTPSSGYSATSTFVSASTPPTPTPAQPRVTPPPSTFYEPPKAAAPVSPTPAISAADRKAREEAVVREVTKAFPTMNLRVSPVAVHTLEGREVETLRFTLDEIASSDVQVDTLSRPTFSQEAIADEIIRDLRVQLPDAPASQG